MIEKIGLRLWDQDNNTGWVKAEDLEAILQSAQVVYGCPEGLFRTTGKPNEVDTHRALLLCVEPTKKKTKAEAALELLEKIKRDLEISGLTDNLDYRRAKRILEMEE